jgi:hypothetical protein
VALPFTVSLLGPVAGSNEQPGRTTDRRMAARGREPPHQLRSLLRPGMLLRAAASAKLADPPHECGLIKVPKPHPRILISLLPVCHDKGETVSIQFQTYSACTRGKRTVWPALAAFKALWQLSHSSAYSDTGDLDIVRKP